VRRPTEDGEAHLPDRTPLPDSKSSLGPLPRPQLRPRDWVQAILMAFCSMALLQLAQHEFLMDLPMLWYHVAATVLSAVVVLVSIVLYLRWRRTAMTAEEALRQLRLSEALREDLTSMLIHDLKNPLTASLLGSQMLQARQDALEPAEQEMLSIAIQNQKRLVTMIEDLLDIARAEGGHMPVHLAPHDLGPVITAAVEEIAAQAREAALTLTVDLGACPPARCDVDKTRRVVGNLLANAVKFTPAGGHIQVSLRQAQAEALVTVRDDGPGIPEHLHERVFEKYAQAQAAAEGHRMSVGLGLAFCRLAVEAQGGRIWVESATGQGSSFTFALPLHSP
jgi:signal transduction histidine kinase